jgi:hypothetical protein
LVIDPLLIVPTPVILTLVIFKSVNVEIPETDKPPPSVSESKTVPRPARFVALVIGIYFTWFLLLI